jgi:hypothetical protein
VGAENPSGEASGSVIENPGPGSNQGSDTQPPGPDTNTKSAETPKVAAENPPPKPTLGSGVDESDVALDEFITISIDSDPRGADVILGTEKIGTTPYNFKLPHGSKKEVLTIHKTGYVDATQKIDPAANDLKIKPELKPLRLAPHPIPSHPPPVEVHHNARPNGPANPDHTQQPKPKPVKCQKPGQVNPFDDECDGKPCPVCGT